MPESDLHIISEAILGPSYKEKSQALRKAWDTRAAIDLLVSRMCIATVVGRRTLFRAIRCLQGRKSRGE